MWGWHDKSSNLLYLTAITPDGHLLAKEMHRDKPPLDQVSSDKFEQMEWFEENAAHIVKIEFGDDALMVGPSSAGINCPNCGGNSARSVAC